MRLTEALDRKEATPHVMHVLNAQGDATMTWSTDVADTELGPDATHTVKQLEAEFDRLRNAGHTAYAVKEGQAGGDVLNRFDATAEKVVMTPQIRGG